MLFVAVYNALGENILNPDTERMRPGAGRASVEPATGKGRRGLKPPEMDVRNDVALALLLPPSFIHNPFYARIKDHANVTSVEMAESGIN